MRIQLSVICYLIVLTTIVGCAQVPSTKQAMVTTKSQVEELPIPPEFKDSVDREFALGRVLKTYDDVAWLGTDAVQTAGFKLNARQQPSYIVEPTSDDLAGVYQFVFITNINGKLGVTAIADVKHDSGMGRVTGAKLIEPSVPPSDQDTWLYQALRAATDTPGLKLCNTIYNHVVFPHYQDGKLEYWVYFLMSSNEKGVIPIGGHVLVRIANDAKTVLEVRPLSTSCAMMTEDSSGKKPVALIFSNGALDSPSAAQVFLMYRYQLPVYVKTKNNYVWGIDSRGIRLLDDGVKH